MNTTLTILPTSVYTDVGGEDMEKERKRYYNPEVASRAQAKYDKTHTTAIHMKLNNITDADILEKLAAVSDGEGKQGYIKRLIRQDIMKGA